MVIPVGDEERQVLQRVSRYDDKRQIDSIIPVKFVPLLGRYGFKSSGDSVTG
jgi:hypothetical protein